MRLIPVKYLFPMLMVVMTYSTPSLSTNEIQEIKRKVAQLEQSMERVEAEMEVIRTQSRMVIQRTHVGSLNSLYLRLGFSLIMPRARTFNFRTDTGLGAHVGVGKYFGRNHVIDGGFEWDIFPSVSARYRLELHTENPDLSFGPVVGYKVKVLSSRPFDNFLDQPGSVNSSFLFFGGMMGFPIGRSIFSLELLYYTNSQAFIFANAGIHVFL